MFFFFCLHSADASLILILIIEVNLMILSKIYFKFNATFDMNLVAIRLWQKKRHFHFIMTQCQHLVFSHSLAITFREVDHAWAA